MNHSLRSALLIFFLLCFSRALPAQGDPFKTNIRPTPWLTPEQEQATFTLPEGFRIELFASEPQIQKPMNMAFDARGRLWLTDTVEYPFPATPGENGRDTVKILEDTNGDGRADSITTFADGLNIPIGLLPYGDGAIVWSIPNIWLLRDTDGDGQAEAREKLYGPMGWERDTHGMNNGFTRGTDGWIYACHGFNNHTRVKGTDGHEITMQSGNTYRFRPDGSRIEHFTHGQVNPFGMTVTELGDLITADCHSKPLYLLLREGYYPSFGKPHDGLGFVPPIMTHTHGSTALCGPAYYAGENFPAEYRGNVFVGNVMTCRVNRNALEWHGSTPVAVEKPDLVTTTDPWFRPVDIQMGPDGALYVADFYNRIIGHYEVPLNHPQRDRTSGRIWRITYEGRAAETQPAARPPELPNSSPAGLLAALNSPNLTYRRLAMNYCADTQPMELISRLTEQLDQGRGLPPAAVSVLERAGQLTMQRFDAALRSDVRAGMVSQLAQILGEREELPDHRRHWLLNILGDDHYRGVAQRHAAEALARHPQSESVVPLLTAIAECPADDPLLRHALRIALRNHLRVEGALEKIDLMLLDPNLAALTAEAALGTESPAAGNFLAAYLARYELPEAEQAAELAQHAARFAAEGNLDRLAAILPDRWKHDRPRQLIVLEGIGRGLRQCGCQPSPALVGWARKAVEDTLAMEQEALAWTAQPIIGKPHRADMFVVETRRSFDGDTNSLFFGSLPHGESLCGIYRSAAFELPAELSFSIAGHNGAPNAKQRTGNKILLRNATSGEILRETPPPRNDVAQRIVWNLKELEGRSGVLEIVDADDGNAYAWLAVGRFSLPELNPSACSLLPQRACKVLVEWGLAGMEPLLEAQLRQQHDPPTLLALSEALLKSYGSDPRLTAMASLLDQPLPQSLRREIVTALLDRQDEVMLRALRTAMRTTSASTQQKLADQLATSRPGASALLDLVAAGHASPRLLVRPAVAEKLATVNNSHLNRRIAELTASLPPANEAITERIRQAQQQFAASEPIAELGREVFKRNCVACHRIGEEGEMIAPQLDGIGNRGLERVLEDLLDPHRNVDTQFRTTTLVLSDGKILSGLLRQAEGKVVELVDSQGKKTSVPAEIIEARKASPLSLMPDNMIDKLSSEELHNLLAFLLEQTALTSPPVSE